METLEAITEPNTGGTNTNGKGKETSKSKRSPHLKAHKNRKDRPKQRRRRA